jgi:hypothetical protein
LSRRSAPQQKPRAVKWQRDQDDAEQDNPDVAPPTLDSVHHIKIHGKNR